MTENNKTIAQVVEEYRNKINSTAFLLISVMENNGDTSEYPNVTGVHETIDDCGKWLEFDYESFTFGKKLHVKLHGHIVKTVV